MCVWEDDPLQAADPNYVGGANELSLLTDTAKRHLYPAALSGIDFGEVEVTVSTQFRELYPNRAIPIFSWLRVHGKAGIDDSGLASDGRLVVSATGMQVLRGLKISQAVVTAFG